MRTDDYYKATVKAWGMKDSLRNIKHRRTVLEICRKDKRAREQNWVMSSRDPLYWMNTFCYISEPRPNGEYSGKIPFNTFDYQDDVIRKIMECIDPTEYRGAHMNKDIWITKCRDMGVSWLCIACFVHSWLFRDGKTFGFMSYKHDLAAKKNDQNSLYGKIDFLISNLPEWMIPKYNAVGGVFTNEERKNMISSEATIENAFRGGRLTGLFVDEFPAFPMEMQMKVMASSQAACGFRVFNGTVQVNDIFDQRVNGPELPNTEVVRLYWWLDPRKTEGMYMCPRTGEKRSLWYDAEEPRAPSKAMFDAEVNLKPIGASQQFFDQERVINASLKRCEPPCVIGDIQDSEIRDMIQGPFASWVPLSKLVHKRLSIGCDISYGNGATNSVASLWDLDKCAKLATYVTPDLDPVQFARVVYWLGNRFKDQGGTPALVIWEEQGPGQQFSKRMKELGYSNLYRRKKNDKYTEETTEFYGYYQSAKTKKELLLNYSKFMGNCWASNKDRDSINEMTQFFFKGKSNDALTVEYVTSGAKADTMGLALKPHGDRVIADALAVWPMEAPSQEAKLLDKEEELRNMIEGFKRADAERYPAVAMWGSLHPIT